MEDPDRTNEDPDRRHAGDGAADDLPFPDKDISPALQRTLKRKFESGEEESVDRETFFRLLGKAASTGGPSS